MSARNTNLLYLFLTAVVVVGGYFFLRYAYRVTDRLPFTQEIVLILLGTVATILITAMLLNKQTEVELRKEQSIKFIELKSRVYMEFIDFIEGLIRKQSLEPEDIVELQFYTHKLAIIASPQVLEQYHSFLEVINQSLRDEEISRREGELISHALAELTVKIREDLVGEVDRSGSMSIASINRQIMDNAQEAIEG